MTLRDPRIDEICDIWEGGAKSPMWISTWMGTLAAKNPCDVWMYQEMIFDTKPDLIIETGSWKGGGALFFASMLDLLGNGEVISVDIVDYPKPKHPRITYLTGESTSSNIIEEIQKRAAGKKVLLCLDSDHDQANVMAELNAYGKLADKYIIVEDTWWHTDTNGPWVAVEPWLKDHPEWQIDKEKERYLLTNNPNGFLKKV